MKFFTYILFSQQLNRFYIGSTALDVNERLSRHLSDYYGITKFTHKAKDWVIFYSIECKSLEQARKIEAHIKRMKSKKYIFNLKAYPDITLNLLEKYSRAQD